MNNYHSSHQHRIYWRVPGRSTSQSQGDRHGNMGRRVAFLAASFCLLFWVWGPQPASDKDAASFLACLVAGVKPFFCWLNSKENPTQQTAKKEAGDLPAENMTAVVQLQALWSQGPDTKSRGSLQTAGAPDTFKTTTPPHPRARMGRKALVFSWHIFFQSSTWDPFNIL